MSLPLLKPSKKSKSSKKTPVIHVQFDDAELEQVYASLVEEGRKNERLPTAQLRHVAKEWHKRVASR